MENELKKQDIDPENGGENGSIQGCVAVSIPPANNVNAPKKKRQKHYTKNVQGLYEGFIYERYNKIEKLSYVGETANEKVRIQKWKQINSNYCSSKKLIEARKKHGVGSDVWEYKILEIVTAPTTEELEELLSQKETEWIYKKDTVNKGYNASYGNGNKGMKLSAAHRAKVSANHRTYQSEEAKQKISASLKGRTMDQSTKDKIRNKITGQKRTQAQKDAQSERVKNDPNTPAQIAKMNAARKAKQAIHGNPLKGRKVTDPALKQKLKDIQQARGTKVRATYPDGTQHDFPTMLDAAKATGHGVGSVYNCLRSGGATKKGFRFQKLP